MCDSGAPRSAQGMSADGTVLRQLARLGGLARLTLVRGAGLSVSRSPPRAEPAAAILTLVTTTSGKIERSGPAIRAVLESCAPQALPRFEEEFRLAARAAGEQLDLAPLDEVLDRWWGLAALYANPLSEDEENALARARAGDYTGFSSLNPDGTWQQL